jgi:Mrp family chromosome partitioning ATPase
VLNSPLIQRLREQQAALNRSRAELGVTYLPNHPKMAAVQSELANINRQIRTEAMKIVDALEDQAKIASTREATLRASLNAAKAKASGTNQDEVKLRALEREAAANRELLETFLNRYTDASTRQELTSQPGMARIIQRGAIPSSPSYPLAGPTILLAALAGLALGLGLAFLSAVMGAAGVAAAPVIPTMPPALPARPALPNAEKVIPPRRRIEIKWPTPRPAAPAPAAANEQAEPIVAEKTTEPPPPQPVDPVPEREEADTGDTETVVEFGPALCELPATPDTSAAIANAYQPIANPSGGFASAMKLVGSWAISARQTLGVQRIAVAGVGHAAPDTAATVAGLGRTLAAQGMRTLIVDVDPSSAVLQVVLGVGQGPGLAELLAGHAPFETVISRDTASAAQLLRAGQNRAAIPTLLASSHLDAVLDALGQVYDMAIIHCGDAEGQASVAVRKCHAAIVLGGAGSLPDAARTTETLRRTGLRAVQFLRINRPVQSAAAA